MSNNAKNFIDLTGQKFGRLTVVSYAGHNAYGKALWNCRCNGCGKECVVRGHDLRNGNTKSCGCLRKERRSNNQKPRNLVDLTGQKFGRLTVKSYAGKSKWNCICDCGKECVIRGASLQNEHTKSCGCLQKEKISNYDIDLIGQKFGHLTVKSYAGKSKWNCICDCGKECVVHGAHLRSGNTKSCGCLRKSNFNTDLIGQKFGRLTVVSYAGLDANRNTRWNCICDCGKECVVLGLSLRCGGTKSCGCLRKGRKPRNQEPGNPSSLTGRKFERHGLSNDKIYSIYHTMMNNCYNPKVGGYKKHGQCGIGVCDEWRGDNGFVNFVNWGMANGYVERADRGGCRLERIDASKDYSPENCRWVVRHD